MFTLLNSVYVISLLHLLQARCLSWGWYTSGFGTWEYSEVLGDVGQKMQEIGLQHFASQARN